MKKIGKGVAIVTVDAPNVSPGIWISGTLRQCCVIAPFWLRKCGIDRSLIAPGDKLEVRIRLIKKGKK